MQIDLQHIQDPKADLIEVGIDLTKFYPSSEWDVISVPAEKRTMIYACCSSPYQDIVFQLTIRRKTLFYTVNLIIPCVAISFLCILVFHLPSDSGEKVRLISRRDQSRVINASHFLMRVAIRISMKR